MSSPLANRSFRKLFAAQIFSLLGVGLLTIALSLASYRAGGEAAGGKILGLLLALKMIAYVILAPFAESFLARFSRKSAMVWLDVGRMVLLIPLAVFSEIWQIAALAFAFFVLSAGFTPLYQSVIPDVLPDEATYSKALAWSRIAYTFESVLSPVLAAVLLNLVSFDTLFLVAATAFTGSIALLVLTSFPDRFIGQQKQPFLKRSGRGLRIYAHTPRLRGLFLLNLALSLAMAWVLVNTVVFAGARLGDAERYFPILMMFFGIGAAVGAFTVPKMLEHFSERHTMVAGAYGFALFGLALALLPSMPISGLAAIWAGLGFSSSFVLTPGGLVITRSAASTNRSAVFAAQFSLSHAGWLIAYPLAGWLASVIALEAAFLVLCIACGAITTLSLRVWPARDPLERDHSHPELPLNHPHLRQVPATGAQHRHIHAFRIDDLHPSWTE